MRAKALIFLGPSNSQEFERGIYSPNLSIEDTKTEFQQLWTTQVDDFSITFAPAPKQTATQIPSAATKLDLFTQEAIVDDNLSICSPLQASI